MEIKLSGVTADYQIGPIRSPLVLDHINLTVASGSFTAVVGPTGAGKSSLMKVLNGLILPEEGQAVIGQLVVRKGADKKTLKAVRKRVGLVFQFPESQIFAETVEKDICFGPLNFGATAEEACTIAADVIGQVGLDRTFLSKSPFSLSGGQKRRVAIAGILACRPDILLLDEPCAGLDPDGQSEILNLLTRWNRDYGMTIVLVTHDMDRVARYAQQAVVLVKGKIVFHDSVRRLFTDPARLKDWDLDLPEARRFQLKLEKHSGVALPGVCLTEEELAEALIKVGRV
ncbi:energy-coupling factor transporter ATPase [Sporolactobacillus vineae]|uniref:energy-coupling factor transporter ATPase n=1 Tax=Sporolactobacillus vineae TaxID=444463 RepID=UPI00028A19A5|nr:energy-coupling factor transporter ATPase [Sporolactobacillus vineae]